MNCTKLRAALAVSTILSSLFAGGVALAQVVEDDGAAPAGARRATPNGGEIVVTATRREERLRDVPVAVSAFTGEDIVRRNVTSLDELQAAIPGIRLVDIGAGSQRIQLRGVSQYLGLPTVGNYIDEFSVSNLLADGAVEVQLIDLERVEVLRGPQPVLYGEGSMGGTIRYITADPDLSEVTGYGTAQVDFIKGGEAGYRTEGAISVPIVEDKVGLRISAARREIGGWIDGPLGEDVNGRRISTVRAKLLARPSERLEISLMGLFNDSDQDSISFSLDGENTAQRFLTPQEQEYRLGVAEIHYDLGPATLSSVTGYMSLEALNFRDTSDFTNVLFSTFGIPVTLDQIENISIRDQKRWSQEVRLTSNGDGPF